MLIGVGSYLVWFTEGINKKELRTEIDIGASSTEVWNILVNINSWKEWNPIISNSSGEVSVGSKLIMEMKGKGDEAGPKYEPVITKLEEPNIFHWRAKMGFEFLFTNDKFMELQTVGSGTKLIHREEYSGLLVPIFWDMLEEGALPMLNSMNEALKKKSEQPLEPTD